MNLYKSAPQNLLYFSLFSPFLFVLFGYHFAVSKSILESTAKPLINVWNGSSSCWSPNSIFWISLSSRRRTVGYDTPYNFAISFNDPDFKVKFFRNVISSYSNDRIHRGILSISNKPPLPLIYLAKLNIQ